MLIHGNDHALSSPSPPSPPIAAATAACATRAIVYRWALPELSALSSPSLDATHRPSCFRVVSRRCSLPRCSQEKGKGKGGELWAHCRGERKTCARAHTHLGRRLGNPCPGREERRARRVERREDECEKTRGATIRGQRKKRNQACLCTVRIPFQT